MPHIYPTEPQEPANKTLKSISCYNLTKEKPCYFLSWNGHTFIEQGIYFLKQQNNSLPPFLPSLYCLEQEREKPERWEGVRWSVFLEQSFYPLWEHMLHRATGSESENEVAVSTWCFPFIPPTSNLHSSLRSNTRAQCCISTPRQAAPTPPCAKKPLRKRRLSRKKTVVTRLLAFNGLEIGQQPGAGAQQWTCSYWKRDAANIHRSLHLPDRRL